MDKNFLSNLSHDLSFRPGIIREALEKGVQFGTKEFFVYSQIRWYETDGKFGFCVASNERLGEDVGMTVKEVENALFRLKEAGLVEHVWCDKKIYRNKTKVWVSMVRLSGVCTNIDAIRVLKKGAKNTALLGKTTCGEVETTCGEVETTCGEVGATPVITEVGNTNRNTNRNKNKKKDDFEAQVETLLSQTLVLAGYSTCATNMADARPSARKCLKEGVSVDDIMQAAKNVKKYKESGEKRLHPVPKSPFQSTLFWKDYYKEEKGNGRRFNF